LARKRKNQRRRRRKAYRSALTYEELAKIESTQQRTMFRPASLPLSSIHVADRVFQWRLSDENILERERHTRVLRKAVADGVTRAVLEPLLVTAIGEKFYLVDGHHRLEAYEEERWQHNVPVRHFDGPLREAWIEALRCNVKDKLPMTMSDKREAAWKLVKRGGHTQVKIHYLTGYGVRSIATMYGVWKTSRDMVRDKTWKEVLANRSSKEGTNSEDWFEERAQKLAEQMLKNAGPGVVRDPDITARALEIISDKLPDGLIRAWLDRAREIVDEITRDEAKWEAEGPLQF
jgi:hypothetical protein